MDKYVIKEQLLDYNRRFKQMMGTFSSFEIAYDYVTFVSSDLYLAEKLLPVITNLQKESENLEKSGINVNDLSFDASSPEALNQIPIFKEQYSIWQEQLNNNSGLSVMVGLPMFFGILIGAAYMIEEIKDNQKKGNKQEVDRLVKEVKDKSFSILAMPVIEGVEVKKKTYGQYIDVSMELVNKFLIDEIDSELLLERDRPQQPVSFDSKNDILYLFGQPVPVRLRGEAPLDHFVLESLSKNNFLELSYYSDIIEDYFEGDYGKYRGLYSACERLNKKIAKATKSSIPDFITFTSGKSGYCRVNTKYLTN